MIKYTPSAKVYERYMDASIELFMECYAETISVASSTDIREQESPQLNEKCKALIKATHRRQKLLGFTRGIRRVLKSAAVLAIAFLSLSSVLFVTVEAVRTPILNFYIKQNDGNWQLSGIPFDFNTDNPENAALPKGFNAKDPLGSLLPDDFRINSVEGDLTDGLDAAYYNDKNNFVIIRCLRAESGYHINTDNAEVERIKISGYDAVLSMREDCNSPTLVWYNSDQNMLLTLKTDYFSKEELINIAELLNYILIH